VYILLKCLRVFFTFYMTVGLDMAYIQHKFWLILRNITINYSVSYHSVINLQVKVNVVDMNDNRPHFIFPNAKFNGKYFGAIPVDSQIGTIVLQVKVSLYSNSNKTVECFCLWTHIFLWLGYFFLHVPHWWWKMCIGHKNWRNEGLSYRKNIYNISSS